MADVITGGDGSATATNIGLSLAELEALEDKKPDTTTPPAEPGSGTNPGADPAETEEQKTAREAQEAEAAKTAADADKNPDGTPKEGAKTGDEPELNDDEVAAKFMEDVNKLHGFEEFKVEYPDGVDPLSPEGVHVREKALIEKAQSEFDNYLKQKDPRGYAYMLHRQSGGNDDDFFAQKSVTLPTYDTFKESVDLQKQVLTRDMQNRGIEPDVIEYMIDKAVKDGKLFDKADAAYRTVDASEKKALQDAEANALARTKAEAAVTKGMLDGITDVVMNSKTSNIVIPDAKRGEFAEYIKQNLYYDGQNFFLTKPLTKENIAEIVQGEYFHFAKGDLKALVERKAKTENANKFRLNAGKTKTTSRSSGEPAANKGYVPLGDL